MAVDDDAGAERVVPALRQCGYEDAGQMNVRNTGKVAGDEVPQLYVRDVQSSVKRSKLELRGFERQPEAGRTADGDVHAAGREAGVLGRAHARLHHRTRRIRGTRRRLVGGYPPARHVRRDVGGTLAVLNPLGEPPRGADQSAPPPCA